jgi:hypothetical protein
VNGQLRIKRFFFLIAALSYRIAQQKHLSVKQNNLSVKQNFERAKVALAPPRCRTDLAPPE